MNKRIGAQLYTVRDFCKTEEEFNTSLSKIKNIGYSAIQLSGVGPIPAKRIKEIADSYNLEIMCTHKSITDFTDNLEQVIEDHRIFDCDIVGIGAMPYDYWNRVEEFIDIINPIAKKLKEAGLQFAYHNHAFEFGKMNGRHKMDYILENTDPEEFKFIVDVYWLAIAGIDPAEFLEKLGDRIAAIHFKDLTMEENSAIMAEVMEGNLNWNKIIAACEKIDAKYILVEQDNCQRDPFDCLETSYKNLKTKGFY